MTTLLNSGSLLRPWKEKSSFRKCTLPTRSGTRGTTAQGPAAPEQNATRNALPLGDLEDQAPDRSLLGLARTRVAVSKYTFQSVETGETGSARLY